MFFKTLSTIGFSLIVCSTASAGYFTPTTDAYPKLSEDTVPCPEEWFDKHAICRTLVEPFGYFDNIQNIGFQAPAGTITDGASIPKFFIPIIGERYTKEFLRASTVHDWYVHRVGLNNNQYSYLSIQRMFYHALLDSDVEPKKAKIMYLAVLIGSNKYKMRISTPPQECSSDIPNCLQNSSAKIEADEIAIISSIYESEEFLSALNSEIESVEFQSINPLDVKNLEERAHRVRIKLGLPEFNAIEVSE